MSQYDERPKPDWRSAKVVTPEEAMERLGISRATFYRYVDRQYFPCFKIGTRSVIPRDEFEKWFAKRLPNIDELLAE